MKGESGLYGCVGVVARGDLEAVKSRVLLDPAVLEENGHLFAQTTPLIHATCCNKPAIVQWLVDQRGQHHLNTHRIGAE